MPTAVVINYGLCNLDSISRALEECGADVRVTDDPAALAKATHLVLPGVGAFAKAMQNLKARGLDAAIRERMAAGVPFLGICLGMQLLAATGTEGGTEVPGLGLVEGDVVRLQPRDGERVPHVGWNEVHGTDGWPLFDGIAPGTDFYFVHSYHVRAAGCDRAASTPYAGGFVSALAKGNVMATQFHPEKSQKPGFQLLRNFLKR